MWVYLLVFLIPLLASFQMPGKRRSLVGLAAFYIFLWVFTGLRFEVGPDWTGYGYIFQAAEAAKWADVVNDREPGFFLINRLAAVLGWGLPGVNAICAAIFLFGVFRYAARTANPWLATAAVVPYLVFIVSMSGIRQSAAMGLAFLALSNWHGSRLAWKLALIFAAASIHNSALVFLVFVIWDGGRYPVLRALLGGGLMLLSFRYLGQSGAAETYASRYFEQNIESSGAIFHVGLSALPAAMYLFFRRQIRAQGGENMLVQRAAILALVLVPMVFVSSTGASRLSLYFSFVQMWAFPAFVLAHGRRWPLANAMCAYYFLAIFLVYFMLGSHIGAYLPYRTLLLEAW